VGKFSLSASVRLMKRADILFGIETGRRENNEMDDIQRKLSTEAESGSMCRIEFTSICSVFGFEN
jgi:hypothetical protein